MEHDIRRCLIELTISRRTGQFEPEVEVVERKGRGHPDTLTDGLAERLSARYCRYTMDRFGVILNHNFDKVGLLGGLSSVAIGSGRMLRPVRVLLNGRAADRFEGQEIPLHQLLVAWTREFLARELPRLDVDNELEFHHNVSSSSTAGYPEDDFTPAGAENLRQLQEIRSSDTAVLCAQYPPTQLERAVLEIEQALTCDARREEWPWLGSDIKVLAWRSGHRVDMTACVPQIADDVPTLDAYRANLAAVRELVDHLITQHLAGYEIALHLNTLDSEDGKSLYLTAIGSCIESGDEGQVGRGNRPSGVIAPLRAHSGEAACGKNPAFFPGKVYNAAALDIARRLHEETGSPIEVWLGAQEGRPLDDPWQAAVIHGAPRLDRDLAERTIKDVLGRISELTQAMINQTIRLC